jgi:hypothetical protein
MKQIIITLFCLFTMSAYTQVGIGGTITNDWYQRYNNPDGPGKDSAGSVLLNIGAGPKIWFGGENTSLSIEGTANLGIVGFSLNDSKGLGMLAIPVVARLNFQGLSCLSKEGRTGFTVGGGLQWNRTELYGISDEFEAQGGTREFFRTIVVEAGFGFGLSGFAGYGIARYGWDPNSQASNFSIGLQFDFNLPQLKQITDPASEL